MKNILILVLSLLVGCSITAYSMNKSPYNLMKTENATCKLSNVTTAYSGRSTQKQFYVTQVCITEEVNSAKEFADKIVLAN